MTWREKHWFKLGTRVVVKRYPRTVRTISGAYITGGRLLNRPVAGLRSWPIEELRRA